MQSAKLMPTPMNADDTLNAIQELPKWIASNLCPLIDATDIETYKHFLVTMYHYTHDAEEQLLYAAQKCRGNWELVEYFEEMAHEERGHYIIAKRDYEEFGGDVEDTTPPSSVKEFRDYWYNLGQRDVNEFVAAMYVFENVAMQVAPNIERMIKRLNLTKKQSRWLWVHLEADVGHGDEAWQQCQKWVHSDPEAFYNAAENGAKLWLDVFKIAFSNN